MNYDGSVVVGIDVETKSFEKQIEKVEHELEELDDIIKKADMGYEVGDMDKVQAKYERLRNTLVDLYNKQSKVMNDDKGFKGQKKDIDDMNKGLGKTIKMVGKWALAVFGVRGAYSMIRRAMSSVQQYDEQMATDMQYMSYILAMTVKPIVEWLVDAGIYLLRLINSISIALFGVNLFANATADGFMKAQKGANKLKKTLLGFDELNVLQDESGGAGATAPSFDASLVDEELVGKIKEAKEEMASWETTLREAMNDPSIFTDAFGNWGYFIQGLSNLWLGLVDIVRGVIDTIVGIFQVLWGFITMNEELMSEGWKKLGDGLITLLQGVIEIIVGLLQMVLGFIWGILKDIWDGIVQLFKDIGKGMAETWDFTVKGLSEVWKNICEFFEGIGDWLKDVGQWFKDVWNGAKKTISDFIDNAVSTFIKFKDKVVDLFKKIGEGIGNIVSSTFKAIINGALSVIENTINGFLKSINGAIGVINKIPGVEIKKISLVSLPRLATGGIVDVPRTGVNIGGAIAGEQGAEGVLPLTNPETMSRLGQEIGKWITLNVDLTTMLDGRVLNKRLEQIKNDNAFARNGVR